MTAPAMLGSRALDALIAEKIMGARWVPLPPRMEGLYGDSGYAFAVRTSDGTLTTEDFCPYYTTAVGDAWLVVEKMRERGWRYASMASEANAGSPTGFAFGDSACSATFSKHAMRGVMMIRVAGYTAHAPTPALAACRAALSSVEASQP